MRMSVLTIYSNCHAPFGKACRMGCVYSKVCDFFVCYVREKAIIQ